jgi:hypothetical protein
MRWNRLAAVAGITSVLIAFVEFFGPGFPQTGASARALDAYFVDHRSWTLATVAVQGLSNAIWLVFLCGLALLLRHAGSAPAATVALTGGALNVAISLAGLAGIAAVSFRIAGSGEPALSMAFFQLSAMTLVLSNFMLALMAAGVACARVAAWFRYASGFAAVVFLAGGGALARHGAFSPDGAVQFATYGLELLWTIAAAVILLRSAPDPTRSALRSKEIHRGEPSIAPGR